MGKCIKCGKETKRYLSFDIDLPRIYTHKKCGHDVKLAFMMDREMAKSFTKKWHQSIK